MASKQRILFIRISEYLKYLTIMFPRKRHPPPPLTFYRYTMLPLKLNPIPTILHTTPGLTVSGGLGATGATDGGKIQRDTPTKIGGQRERHVAIHHRPPRPPPPPPRPSLRLAAVYRQKNAPWLTAQLDQGSAQGAQCATGLLLGQALSAQCSTESWDKPVVKVIHWWNNADHHLFTVCAVSKFSSVTPQYQASPIPASQSKKGCVHMNKL